MKNCPENGPWAELMQQSGLVVFAPGRIAETLWRHALKILEDPREIALVAKAAFIRNLRDGFIRCAQQITGLVYSALSQ